MAQLRLLACLISLLLAGCTAVGIHDPALRGQIDFGPPDAVAICVYIDDGLTDADARTLVHDAWRKEEPLYRLTVSVVSVTHWPRPAFTMNGIMRALRRQPLAAPCDRVLALIGRNAADFLFSLLPLPEVLGAVDDETLTHGYAVARWASLNQVFTPPRAAMRHELYHLLGCDEHFNMPRCYEQIAYLKRWKRTHHSDFFPAWDSIRKRLLTSRDEVNARLAALVPPSSNSGTR